MRSFGWLHFTDLHQGLDAQGWLWPGVREILFADLEKLHERCGPWDVVLFSGDLTQRAAPEEFARLSQTLAQLWAHLKTLGSTPSLLAVPGNHDLVRPDPRRPETLVLARWPNFPEVQVEFWRDKTSPYRHTVEQAFANYAAWEQQVDGSWGGDRARGPGQGGSTSEPASRLPNSSTPRRNLAPEP